MHILEKQPKKNGLVPIFIASALPFLGAVWKLSVTTGQNLAHSSSRTYG
jgi:hypothetical protein